MSNDPDVIRAQIESTRAGLSDDVNELGQKVSPSQIAKRQGERIKGAAVSVKDRIMGSADAAKSECRRRHVDCRRRGVGCAGQGGQGYRRAARSRRG